MEISGSIEGLDRLQSALRRVPAQVGPVARRLLERATLAVQKEAMARTPVVTGHLRRSLTTAIDPAPAPTWGKVGSNLVYAPFIEFGERHDRRAKGGIVRRKAGPARMLRGGFEAAQGTIRAAVAQAGEEIKALWRA